MMPFWVAALGAAKAAGAGAAKAAGAGAAKTAGAGAAKTAGVAGGGFGKALGKFGNKKLLSGFGGGGGGAEEGPSPQQIPITAPPQLGGLLDDLERHPRRGRL